MYSIYLVTHYIHILISNIPTYYIDVPLMCIYMVTPPAETYLFAILINMEGCQTLMLSVSIVQSY